MTILRTPRPAAKAKGRHDLTIVATSGLPLEQKFAELVQQWLDETLLTSSVTDMVMHPAYQQIIGLGSPAVPLLLRELQERPNHWFWALFSITGENPVPPGDAGNLQKMTEAWMAFGRRTGYI